MGDGRDGVLPIARLADAVPVAGNSRSEGSQTKEQGQEDRF